MNPLFATETAERYLQMGLPDQALSTLKRALSEDPELPEAHIVLALTLLDLRRIHAALHEARLGVSLDPDNDAAHRILALVLHAHRKLDDAETHARLALELGPEIPENHMTMAMLAQERSKPEAAREHVDVALRLDPEHVGARTMSAELLFDAGDIVSATNEVEDALRLEPENARALVLRGSIHLREGRVDDAQEHVRWVLSNNGMDEAALRLLVAIKAKQSWFMGLWWRYAMFLARFRGVKQISILLLLYLVFRVGAQVITDSGNTSLGLWYGLAWLAFIAYTWFGVSWVTRAIEKELAPVRLNDDF